ncbi:MAG: DEAD/DEAH box helicase family protein [Phycisphaerae bacterium]|nr:DEAD/DEAH box helicase family protein [Phycisphaerae bacterium]
MTNNTSLRFDRGTLVVRGVDETAARAIEDWPCVWDPRVGAWRCEAILLVRVIASLRSAFGGRWSNEIAFPKLDQPLAVNLPALRPDQTEAVDSWERAAHRGQVIMPTGTGKTIVALAAMARTRVSTLVVAPVRDLMYQWHRRILSDLGYDAGIIGDSHCVVRPISVTTYDSAYIHMAQLGNRFELVIFDEEHHLPARSLRESAILSAAPMRLGLTATPIRADGRHVELDQLIGPVSFELPFDEARRDRLADFDVVRIPVALSDNEQSVFDRCSRAIVDYIRERRSDRPQYRWEDVCKDAAVDARARHVMQAFFAKRSIEDRAEEKLRILEDLFRLHIGSPTIVFAGSNAMAIDISERFLIPTILAHSPKGERQAVLEGFASGEFPAVVANQVLDEGVDMPDAKVAVVLGGHGSTRQSLQRLGRVLRKVGDNRAVLYDVVSETSGDIERSRARRRNDAYRRTRHRHI